MPEVVVSLLKSFRGWLALAILLGMAGLQAEAKEIPGLSGKNRAWAALLIEDHKGMQEVVWDAAFTDLQAAGPFVKDHSYVIRTGSTPSLLDLGCWDAARTRGGECHNLAASYSLSWVKDHKGVILKSGSHATWLPALSGYDGDEVPSTFRGAYLNWLLTHRSTTPSIPSETRWQRTQRGALAMATELLSRSGGKPVYRLVGIGTSGHLLIPPAESLAAVQQAIQRMTPRAHDGEGGHDRDDDRDRDDDCDHSGSMLKALQRAYDAVTHASERGGEQEGQHGDDDHRDDHDHDDDHDGGQAQGCAFELVIPISDGMAFGSSCGSARAYETLSSYSDMLKVVSKIAATGQAVVWSWDVEGPGIWDKDFASKGRGQAFEGDAVVAMTAAIKGWMARGGSAPAVTLTLSNPVLTRFSAETLTVILSSAATSATLNGQPLALTGLVTSVPLTLVEGANAFVVAVPSPCGTTQASISVVLDTHAPLITIQSPGEGSRTNAASVILSGRVDDSTAVLTVNGQPMAQINGLFTASFTPAEGPFALTVVATDPAGNSSSVVRTILVDRIAPRITLTKPLPALTSASTLSVQGQVDDPTATLTLNGQALALNAQGGFSTLFSLVEGANAISLVAVDSAGNVGHLDVAVTRDSAAPALRFTSPAEGLVTNVHSISLVGQVDDPSATVLVNGQSMTLDAAGTFHTTVATIEGPMSFLGTATDAAGNASQATRSILVDWTAPVISLDTPAPKLISAVTCTLAGRVDDPKAAFKVNGQPAPLDALGHFSVTLSLAEGANAFHLEATDLAGNLGSLDGSVVRDTIPPRIILTKSVPALTGNANLTMQGAVDDLSAILTLNGAVIPFDATGAFTVSVSLAEGPNGFTFMAQDPAGNAGTLTVVTALDTQAPVLKVAAPAEGLRTSATQLSVTGSVDDLLAQVKVNDQTAVLDGSGAFAVSLNPAEGPLTILVTATDPIGNQSQGTRHIVIDRTAPRIALTKPVPALVAVTSLTLQGAVDDPSAQMTFNGAALALDAQGAFTVEAPLVEGPNSFHFEATDLTGNIGVLDAKTVRDTIAPVVTLDAPQDGLVSNQHSLVVKGRVDDPTARLLVAGQSVSPTSDGGFEITLTPAEGAQLIVVLATDPAGNTGHAVRSVTLDWTPPVLAWATPTPAEGAKLTALPVAVAATVSEFATVLLNGQSLTLENGAPFLAKSSLSLAEGPVTLSLDATDRAGNTAHLERHFELGLTAPKVVIEAPAEGLQTKDANAVLVGHVESGDYLKPLTLTLNGATVVLGADGRFSLPVSLVEGANAFRVQATNAFGLQGQADRTLNRFTTSFGVQIDWPLEGLAIPEISVEVRGRVRRAGTTVTVNGVPAAVAADTLSFTVVVPLQPGANTLVASAADSAGNQGEAQVHVTCAPPEDASATYRWDLPLNAATSRTRLVHVRGQADLPGVASVKVNGLPMSLSGVGKEGQFEGDVPLDAKGRNVIFLEARTLAGSTLTERREVAFVPELPRIRLQAPETARPGDTISLQVTPEVGTTLKSADVSWNGRLLAQIADPFAAVTAQVPGDAAVGSRILVEALATDAQGEQVTARAYVTVYGLGALLVEAYDDSLGLLLKAGLATVEGGESLALDGSGKAALRTALPQNWIKVSQTGFTPVWRAAGMQVGGVQSVVDARLTPLVVGQAASAASFTGSFGKGALALTFPAGTFAGDALVSATALSTQGLPGLLPTGWSAVSAWWLDASLPATASGTAQLALATGTPQENLAWARWDESLHAWITLAMGLRASDLATLALPALGGYVLVVPDAGATAPAPAIVGAQLPAFEGIGWRDGLAANGTVDPAVLPTTTAIRGARATAKFSLGFDGKDPLPSGALVQVDVLESYALLDSALIEPDGFTQDAVLARWILGVDSEGGPTLKAAQDLGLELPVRMSRTFQENELVDGRIWVGFYHDGIQMAQSGSELLDASGGLVTHDGILLTVPSQALTGTTLIRLNADQGDLTTLWPELTGQGTLAKSFQLDLVGTIQQGLQLQFNDLGQVSQGIAPLLVQRRVVEGERVLVTVGGLEATANGWALRIPDGAAPLTSGGAFAVLIPAQAWDWISGQATVPASVAQPLVKRMGAKAHLVSVQKPKANSGLKARASKQQTLAAGDYAVADAMVEAGYLKAVSAADGSFAVPAYSPAGSTLVTVHGERRDLGVRGSVDAAVPSAGQTLRLGQVPFQVLTVVPSEMAEVGVGTVVEVQVSTAADPLTVDQVKLYQEGADASQLTEVAARRTLGLDGRTLLLTPEAPLPLSAIFRVVTLGLASLSGEAAPAYTRRFKTMDRPQAPDVDLSRIKLSYPTDAFDVTVTIPEGAVPAWSIVSVEASQMGSYGQGVMPPRGDLVFPLKASLGERLKVMVQLRDGSSVSGTIGRYVADDGRTTLGVDGGRVEGPGGLAISVPAGALENASELRVVVSTEAPLPADGSLLNGEQMGAALELRSKDPISFKTPPILEMPISSVPAGMMTTVDTALTFGNGPVPVYQKVVTKLPDGTEDFSYVLVDTAQLSSDGQKLQSAGGLRVSDPLLGTVVHAQPVRMSLRNAVNAPVSQAQAGPKPERATKVERASSYLDYEPYSVGFFTMFIPVAVYEPQYMYTSGTVYRNWNGSGRCGGSASASCYGELALAEVHRYEGTTGLDAARKGRLSRGRLLTTCDSQGRYTNVGGPEVSIPGQSWIALFAVDPRTGETSIDDGSPGALTLGLPYTRREHSLAITSQGGNPFDPALTAPRIRAQMVDGTGTARTMFTVGEAVTMKITTETGSQSVVRGKISGSITQDFGTLPAEVAVTFAQEGTWKADILGWTAKPVQGAASVSVIVTPAGVLGPALPGKPTIISKNPADGDKDVDPSGIVKLTFSEPVHGVTATAFIIEVNHVRVPFKAFSNAREVTDAATQAQEIWLVPDQRFTLGATVSVSLWSSLIVDQEGLSPDPASWSFTVRGADEVGSLAGVGTFSQMVVHKGKIYSAEDVGTGYYFDGTTFQVDTGMRKHGIRVMDATDPSNPKLGPIFGEFGSWDPASPYQLNLGLAQGPFSKSSISGMRVATGVTIGGKTRDVLLVATRPWSVQEILMSGFIFYDEYVPGIYRIRHNALWVFDITDDADSTEVSMGNTIPKLLMSSSQGTMSDNWIKGLGSAGGVLGSIKLRGGLTMWDANQWQGSWQQDQATLSDWTIRYRTAGATGYYPDPTSLVASNGFYDASGNSQASVTSAVVADDANGQPIGFATMGYSTGYLMAIDGKVGEPMAKATYSGGGPHGLDSRLHDLSPTVNNEPANAVEVLKGSWQGPGGTEQGTLLLVGTTAGTGAHFWVLNADLTNMNNPGASQYGLATLPGRITRIVPDPARMLVGVEAGGRGYVFDLKNLQPTVDTPMTLMPIFDFAVSGAWTVTNGFLFCIEGGETRKLEIKNIDGNELEMLNGAPIPVEVSITDGGTEAQFDSAVVSPTTPTAQKATSISRPMAAVISSARYVYAMAATQGKNGGYPWLRYCYPELGPMQMSAVIQPKGDLVNFDLADRDKAKIVAKIALYLNGTSLGESGLTVTALDVNGDQVTPLGTTEAPLKSDKDLTRLPLITGEGSFGRRNEVNTTYPKYFYAPFQVEANSISATLQNAIRQDIKGGYRIKVRFTLWIKEGGQWKEKTEVFKELEYAVKYNANTTLYDVARGGVWHYDPDLSGGDPASVRFNPVTNNIEEGTTPEAAALREKLSITRGVGTSRDFFDHIRTPLGNQKLDAIQVYLRNIVGAMRYKVGADNSLEQLPPVDMNLVRPTGDGASILSSDPTGPELGDARGAFGVRTLRMVNAIQSFSNIENEDGGKRDIRQPQTWAVDPLNGEGKILPALNQKLISGPFLRADATYFHYMAMYPAARKKAQTPSGNLAPMNALITSDLVFGPSFTQAGDSLIFTNLVTKDNEKSTVTTSLADQRKNIDKAIIRLRQLPTFDPDDAEAKSIFGELEGYITRQDLIVYKNEIISGHWGNIFNPGIGILQLAYSNTHKEWLKNFRDTKNPPPFVAPGLEMITQNPLAANDYANNRPDDLIYTKVEKWLIDSKAYRSPRLDVYINGVWNSERALQESLVAFQGTIRGKECEAGNPCRVDAVDDPAKPDFPYPLIGVLNRTGSWGGIIQADVPVVTNALDILETAFEKFTTSTDPDVATSDRDSVRLIVTLKSVVQALYQPAFKQLHHGYQRDKGLPGQVWDLSGSKPRDSGIDVYLLKNPEETDAFQLVPKTQTDFADEFPASDPNREVLIEAAKALLRAQLKVEIIRLDTRLAKFRKECLTLHAHSQGSLKVATAHTRVGEVRIDRNDLSKGTVRVAEHFHVVTYGGVADMFDWDTGKDRTGNYVGMKDYQHHVNTTDTFTLLGMQRPFLFGTATLPVGRLGVFLPWLVSKAGTADLPGHIANLKIAAEERHKIIFHDDGIAMPWGVATSHPVIPNYVCYLEALSNRVPVAGQRGYTQNSDPDLSWLWNNIKCKCRP
jgi:hypothetical protein